MKNKSFNNVFSKNLRYYFDLSGMTQAEFAKKLGVGTTSIYNWLSGVKTPRMDKVDAMCKLFGVHRESLITDNMAREEEIATFAGNTFKKQRVSVFAKRNDFIKERIKAIRKTFGFTQQEYADRLNIQRGSIASYETGRISPSNATISLICKELNVSEDWLRNGNGDIFIPITIDEEIETFIGSVQADISNAFKKRFISALAKLSTEEWKAIEHLMENMISEREQ